MIPFSKYFDKAVLLLLSTILIGCGSLKTSKDHYLGIDQKVDFFDFRGAAKLLEAEKEESYGDKDRVLAHLDLGMLYHYAGDYKKSNEELTLAEERIEDLFTSSISKAVGSILLNDNALDYSGEDYEDIYLNVFKSLNYLHLGEFNEAFVEIRRINEKLANLELKYEKVAEEYNKSKDKKTDFKVGKTEFHNSALARLLSLLFYRTVGQLDEARIDLQKIKEAWNTQPSIYNFYAPPLDNYVEKSQKAKVNFISFIGQSPEKFAKDLIVHTENNLAVVYQSDGQTEKKLDAFVWPGISKGLHLKFSMPYVQKRGSEISRVEAVIQNKKRTTLKMIESIEAVANETFKLKEPIILVKAITRTIVKALLNEAVNKEIDKQTGGGIFGSITRAITGAALDATENADLRISHYFPSSVLIGELEVEPGYHNIVLKYYGRGNELIMEEDFGKIYIAKNKLNLFESFQLE